MDTNDRSLRLSEECSVALINKANPMDITSCRLAEAKTEVYLKHKFAMQTNVSTNPISRQPITEGIHGGIFI
eukprot:m.254174 g.254174  ORF g.254174 m.254174 type:complete len:72 (+) comp16168_c0_seq4:1238-1453(+)